MTVFFDMEADSTDYDVEQPEEPYLTKGLDGKYVILQDEILKCANPTDERGRPMLLYSEILIDPNPSKEKIFKMKLRGHVRPSTFVAHRHSKGS